MGDALGVDGGHFGFVPILFLFEFVGVGLVVYPEVNGKLAEGFAVGFLFDEGFYF